VIGKDGEAAAGTLPTTKENRIPRAGRGFASLIVFAVAFFSIATPTWAESDIDPKIAVEYFALTGCRSCEVFYSEVLEPLSRTQPLSITRYSTLETEGFEHLHRRLAVHRESFSELPVVFIGNTLLQDAVSSGSIRDALDQMPSAAARESASVDVPSGLDHGTEVPDSVIDAFGVGEVLLAGLVDGINPCAFTLIVFLVSSLAVGGRGRQDIAAIGLSFSAGVFTAYAGLGFGALGALKVIMQLSNLANIMRFLGVLVPVLLAVVSLYDARMLAIDRKDAVLLRLPKRPSDRAHAAVRTKRRRGFVGLDSFALGLSVSLLEIVCTGQVYLPTLVYLSNQGSRQARFFLLGYNLAFVTPLLVVVLAMWSGADLRKLSTWARKNAAATKLALAAVFVLISRLMVVQWQY
jgi:cytochrome c biogenesis protein CcdA